MSSTLKVVVLVGAAMVTAMVGLVCTGMGLGSVRTERYLDAHAARADATVQRTDRDSGSIAISYPDRSSTVHRAHVDWQRPLPGRGSRVLVEYDPRRPEVVRQPGSNAEIVLGGAFVIAGLLLLAGPTCLLSWRAFSVARRARLRAKQALAPAG